MRIPVAAPIVRLSLTALLAGFTVSPAICSPVKVDTNDYKYKHLQHASNDDEHKRDMPKDTTNLVVYAVPPAIADPAVTRYLRDSYAYFDKTKVKPQGNLFLWLVGTSGNPDDAKLMPLAAAAQGYMTIALMYNTLPATAQACDNDPDPNCSERFRERRTFGTPVTEDIDDTPNECVVHRFTALLTYLSKKHPADGWGGFLLPDGTVNWERVVVAGHSQGAGIAAYIAKHKKVARVAMFSDWDYYIADGHHHPVPWLSGKSATPADRWWATYHQQEPTVKYELQEYQALEIPASHVVPVNLPPRKDPKGFHTSVSGDTTTPLDADGKPAYLPMWKELIGTP